MVATAIIGAGLAGAGATIFGANTAANAQTNAANAAIANQQKMYANNQNVLNPFIQGGTSAIPQLQALLNPNNASGPLSALSSITQGNANGNNAAALASLANTPGYQFNLQQGQLATNNQLAARGLGGSGGAVAKGAANYAEGLAGNTWQSVVSALQNSFNSQVGAQQNLVNSGMQAGSALAGVGTNTANSISGSLTGAGNAQAAGANAIGGAVSNAANQLPSNLLLSQLLGGSGANGAGGLYVGPSSVGGAPLSGYSGIAPATQGLGGYGAIS